MTDIVAVPEASGLQYDQDIACKQIYATRNYGQFRLDEINRPLIPTKVNRMAISLKEDGNWLDQYPITVSADGTVEDGQHRLKAAEMVGTPIYFIISTMGIINVGLVTMNTDKWTTQDFHHHYVAQGLPDYVWLDEFLKRNEHMTLSAALSTIRNRVSPLYDTIRSGKLEIDDERKELVEQVAALSLRLKPFLPVLYRTNGVQQSLRIMLEHGRFDEERLINQFKNSGRTIFRQPRLHDYVREFESIYNYGFSVNRVNFLESRSNH